MAQPQLHSGRGDYDGLLSSLAPMLRMARGLTASLEDAEDLVHDVITTVLPRWGNLTSDPTPYLFRAVYNRVVSRHRRTTASDKANDRLRQLQPRDDHSALARISTQLVRGKGSGGFVVEGASAPPGDGGVVGETGLA